MREMHIHKHPHTDTHTDTHSGINFRGVLGLISDVMSDCLMPSVLRQDKAQPDTQARSFGDVPFNALLAVDDPSALTLVKQPGSDGFRVDSDAMFQV